MGQLRAAHDPWPRRTGLVACLTASLLLADLSAAKAQCGNAVGQGSLCADLSLNNCVFSVASGFIQDANYIQESLSLLTYYETCLVSCGGGPPQPTSSGFKHLACVPFGSAPPTTAIPTIPPAQPSGFLRSCTSVLGCQSYLLSTFRRVFITPEPPEPFTTMRRGPGSVGSIRGRGADPTLLFTGFELHDLGSPAFKGMELTFPASMASPNLGFSFAFSNVGDGDWLSVSFDGVTLWEGLGTSFQPDELYDALIPTAGLAGQHGVLLFILTSVGQPNARVMIGDPTSEVELTSPFPGTVTFTRLAGTGAAGWNGDGGAADQTQLSAPTAVVADADGNLFIADRDNHRIRRVDAVSGNMTTVAGDGTPTFAGDGLAATLASLSSPSDVALDTDGNLFIADRDNHRIRRVDAISGLISTVAGNGTGGYTADNVPATASALNKPTGIAFDTAGALFIADSLNHRLRRVSSGTITTVAGNGTQTTNSDGTATAVSLVLPQRVAFAGGDQLVVSEGGKHRVRRLDLGDNLLTTIAGTGSAGEGGDFGLALAARLRNPSGLAIGTNGDVWLADAGNHLIRHLEASSGRLSSEVGSGIPGYQEDPLLPGSDRLNGPGGLALLPNGHLIIADTANHVVREATLVVADLQLTAPLAPATVAIGSDVTFTFQIANTGPNAADYGLFNLDLPISYLRPVTTTPSQGACQPGPPATCELGTIPAGQAATVTTVLHASYLGATTLQAAAASSRAELTLGNNVLTRGITVVPPNGIFANGFEGGSTTGWSGATSGP
jgi:hypothetical protein